MSLRSVMLSALVLIAAAMPAAANDFQTCEKESGDIAIAACDRLIASGAYSGVKLSEIYNSRGYELERKGQLDRAIGDYNTSIALNPKYSFVYNNRGNARYARRDIDGSIADYTAAIGIDSDYAIAYANRGLSYEAKGDKARAIADFRATLTKSDRHGSSASAKNTARERLRVLGQ